jgi:hypothetical protein
VSLLISSICDDDVVLAGVDVAGKDGVAAHSIGVAACVIGVGTAIGAHAAGDIGAHAIGVGAAAGIDTVSSGAAGIIDDGSTASSVTDSYCKRIEMEINCIKTLFLYP